MQHSAARADAPRRAAVLLAPGSGYQQAAGSGRVRALQRRLAGSGFAPGPIDGRYGPLTTHAVIGFQAAQRLRVDGLAGPETLTQLLRVTARAGARSRRAQRTPPASTAARSPRPAAARPSAPGPLLPRTAQDPVATKSLPRSPVASVPASGGWPVFWLMLAGVTAAMGVLVGVALRRRSRMLPRRRRNIGVALSRRPRLLPRRRHNIGVALSRRPAGASAPAAQHQRGAEPPPGVPAPAAQHQPTHPGYRPPGGLSLLPESKGLCPQTRR